MASSTSALVAFSFLLLLVAQFLFYSTATEARRGRDVAEIPVDKVRTALTDTPGTQMSIMWHTMTLVGAKNGPQYNPTVVYGFRSGQYNGKTSAPGSSQAYYKPVGYSHWVVLDNLIPNTLYYYKCGDPNYGWSVEYTFKTGPYFSDSGSTSHLVHVYMLGDMGVTNDNFTVPMVAQRIQNKVIEKQKEAHSSQLLIHVGDIGYADDSHAMKPQRDYEEVWSTFLNNIEPISARVPYMVCPGNHEYYWPGPDTSLAKNFTVYNSVFRMPGFDAVSKPHNMWYSFDYGNIHFVAISTETDFPDAFFACTFGKYPGEQLDWLHKDLSQVNREKTPWVVVYGHRPIYSSISEFSKNNVPILDSLILQRAFESILKKYSVDLFVVGHVHSYERTYPMYQNQATSHSYVNPPDTIHIVNGAGGNMEGLTPGKLYNKESKWAGHYYYDDEGYAILTTDLKKESRELTLKWQYFRAGDDRLNDEVIIRKSKK